MTDLQKIKAKTAQEVVDAFPIDLEPEALALLDENQDPQAYLAKLETAGLIMEALKFLAFALPKREATWWCCLAARHAEPDLPKKESEQARQAAEAWVFKPTEEHRWAAFEAGEKAGYDTASAMAAHAAGWSSGSLTRAGLDPVEPPEELTGQAIKGAMSLAIFGGEATEIEPRSRLYLAQALDIARGGNGRVHADGSRIQK